jgi:SAM-dependent methyltransferase
LRPPRYRLPSLIGSEGVSAAEQKDAPDRSGEKPVHNPKLDRRAHYEKRAAFREQETGRYYQRLLITTDLFHNPWIDQVETAYALSFGSGELSNIILFDVFHHLEFPGTALDEFHRVLAHPGRVIIFDPAISLLGWLVYGACHAEPIGWRSSIRWTMPSNMDPRNAGCYAAQGNATRVFATNQFASRLSRWRVVLVRRLAAVSYVASGGYSGPQLYPASWIPFLTVLDHLCDRLPRPFATRLLVVLEKN